jgi:hypothetical protein
LVIELPGISAWQSCQECCPAVWQQAFTGSLPGEKARSDIKCLGSRLHSTIRIS